MPTSNPFLISCPPIKTTENVRLLTYNLFFLILQEKIPPCCPVKSVVPNKTRGFFVVLFPHIFMLFFFSLLHSMSVLCHMMRNYMLPGSIQLISPCFQHSFTIVFKGSCCFHMFRVDQERLGSRSLVSLFFFFIRKKTPFP